MRGLQGERAQALVEYALVVPILLLLFLGIMEFGILVFDYNTIANAAREGARHGIVHWRDADVIAGIEDAARRSTEGLDQAALDIVATIDSDSTVARVVRVEVNYQAQLLTAPIIRVFAGDDSVSLSAVATMQLE